jgi:hypothetical protein
MRLDAWFESYSFSLVFQGTSELSEILGNRGSNVAQQSRLGKQILFNIWEMIKRADSHHWGGRISRFSSVQENVELEP